jgi:hypothetical protein
MLRLPKLNKHHQYKPADDDFFLGNMSEYSLDTILIYSSQSKKIQNIDKTNCFETHGFDFMNPIVEQTTFYMCDNKLWRHNTFLCAILYLISPRFSLLKSDDTINDYLFEFRKRMGLDLEEKQLSKKLELKKYKLRRKVMEELLFRNPIMKNYNLDDNFEELVYVIKYICLRFKIGAIIVDNEKNYWRVMEFENRMNIILLKKDRRFFVLCSTDSESNLFSNAVVKKIVSGLNRNIVSELKDIKNYKVDELKVIAKRLGLDISKNKSELYDDIKKCLFN